MLVVDYVLQAYWYFVLPVDIELNSGCLESNYFKWIQVLI